ncbi:hypothetical protein BKA70DRAFT_1301114 [Coprinopsis sp. MPI-PUGE-AT-0042]|nr:hypothetical protein BKA70DRAFT_1301114 [Coprinopsis sp. MPI-PUGE-AT-0042]
MVACLAANVPHLAAWPCTLSSPCLALPTLLVPRTSLCPQLFDCSAVPERWPSPHWQMLIPCWPLLIHSLRVCLRSPLPVTYSNLPLHHSIRSPDVIHFTWPNDWRSGTSGCYAIPP